MSRLVRVLDPLQVARATERFEFVPAHAEQRPHELARTESRPRGNRAQPPDARAAHQAQQEGLDLIVGMVRGQQRLTGRQRLRKGGVAGTPGGGLDAVAGRAIDIDQDDFERHSQRSGHARAMRRPGIRIVMQTVIDVDGSQAGVAEFRAQFVQRVQEHRRIESAAERDTPLPRFGAAGRRAQALAN